MLDFFMRSWVMMCLLRFLVLTVLRFSMPEVMASWWLLLARMCSHFVLCGRWRWSGAGAHFGRPPIGKAPVPGREGAGHASLTTQTPECFHTCCTLARSQSCRLLLWLIAPLRRQAMSHTFVQPNALREVASIAHKPKGPSLVQEVLLD